MRAAIVIILVGTGYLFQYLGGFVLIGMFFYGIYTLFTTSIATGLMTIGAVVVGGWVIQIVSGILIAMGAGVAKVGVKDEE